MTLDTVPIEYCIYQSAVGPIRIASIRDGKEKFICCIGLRSSHDEFLGSLSKQLGTISPVLQSDDVLCGALERYFQGETGTLDALPTRFLWGTPFQQNVWHALKTIPYGATRSYSWLAEKTGNAKACRAVGRANGKNPVPIIFPCHRVINADGGLGGYSSGIDIKRYLLELEKS